jgi:hypothetical protein
MWVPNQQFPPGRYVRNAGTTEISAGASSPSTRAPSRPTPPLLRTSPPSPSNSSPNTTTRTPSRWRHGTVMRGPSPNELFPPGRYVRTYERYKKTPRKMPSAAERLRCGETRRYEERTERWCSDEAPAVDDGGGDEDEGDVGLSMSQMHRKRRAPTNTCRSKLQSNKRIITPPGQAVAKQAEYAKVKFGYVLFLPHQRLVIRGDTETESESAVSAWSICEDRAGTVESL